MKYFTPELFIAYNSPDDQVAELADKQWDEQEGLYKRHLVEILPQMPESIRELSRLCLHDADVISRQTVHQSHILDAPCTLAIPFWAALEVVSLRMGDDFVFLFYTLAEAVRTTPPPDAWTFGKGPEMWLYDEVDLLFDRRPAIYTHSILFSSGRSIEIPFVTVLIHRVRYPIAGSQKS